MKIYDLIDESGHAYAFEVGNIALSRRDACELASTVAGVQITRRPRRWGLDDDEFCEFAINGVTFVIWEPFGDNSRFWVGPQPLRPVPELAAVRDVFAKAKPVWFPTLRRWMHNL
jgi:hypothetical protein